jgi:predicted transcriptional regulator
MADQAPFRSLRAARVPARPGQLLGDQVQDAERRCSPYQFRLWRLCWAGITGYTPVVKTAISLPDELFAAIDACARELKTTRSGLLARAAREFVARHRRAPNPTEAWDEVIRQAGQPGDEPAARAFRRRTKAVLQTSRKGGR